MFAGVNVGVARIRQLPAGERSAATREFYADFAVAHRRVISMVFFDRGALKPDDAAEVDRLVDAVSPLLSGRDDAEGMAAGEILVYGLAALVTRRPDLDDRELRALLDRAVAGMA